MKGNVSAVVSVSVFQYQDTTVGSVPLSCSLPSTEADDRSELGVTSDDYQFRYLIWFLLSTYYILL